MPEALPVTTTAGVAFTAPDALGAAPSAPTRGLVMPVSDGSTGNGVAGATGLSHGSARFTGPPPSTATDVADSARNDTRWIWGATTTPVTRLASVTAMGKVNVELMRMRRPPL